MTTETAWRADTTGVWHAGRNLREADRARWVDSLEAFETNQRAKGAAESTIRRRVKHVRAFAVHADKSPWHVTFEDTASWLQGLDVAENTRLSMRDSLRSFYRWAAASGRVEADPTWEDPHRAKRLPVPDSWQAHLVPYERHLQARGVAPHSVRSFMEQLRNFARENASFDPMKITVDDLYEWMAGKQWARETRRARKVALRGFYGWAVDTGRREDDPTAKLPKVRSGEPVARPATDSEYEAALRAAEGKWRLALRLAAELGLRREEVARIHSADIVQRDDDRWWLTVHGKGSKTRVLPLPEALALTLRTMPEGYVFPGQIVEKQRHSGLGHVSPRWMGKRVKELLPEGVTMHSLRHRFATRVYNHNRDVFTVQKLLGHASAATTQRYVQVSDERMRALVEAVNP